MTTIEALSFDLDRSNGAPLYKQISDRLMEMIGTGELSPGSVLWPERVLSDKLNVSRGTIRKAYALCKDASLLTVVQGSNYRVAGGCELHRSPEEKALCLSMNYISEMERLGYDRGAAIDMLRLNGQPQAHDRSKIRVGAVECRRSMFYIYDGILGSLENIETDYFIMDELIAFPEQVRQAEQCDLLLVTAAHYYELCEARPELEPKMLEIAIAWNEDSIDELKKLRSDSSVGILYSNIRTVFVIKSALHTYSIDCNVDVCNINSQYALDSFFREKQILIIEPTYDSSVVAKYESEWNAFFGRGGKRIIFQHDLLPSAVQSIQRALLRLREQKR